MSLPHEEARSLDDALQFLLDVCSGREKRIPTVTRERARRIARHYPLAAGCYWLDREDRGAVAWDDGWEAGYRDHLRWMKPDADDAATENPYRETSK